jgi:cyclopropane-fatty-acyl-phospholipid synthase
METGLGGQVDIRLADYRDLREDPFDRIVSVGMFEHIGRPQLPVYFDRAWRFLRPGGLFLNHGIAKRAVSSGPPAGTAKDGAARDGASPWRRSLRRLLVGEGEFSQRYVFPDSQLLPLSEVNLAAERAGFEVRDVENLREHYALTLRLWAMRLEARRDEAIRLTDEVTFRTWRAHLVSSAHLFETAAVSVHQTLLSRPERGASHLPLTRADLYAGGRA